MTELFDSLLATTDLHTVMQYLIGFCSQPKAASDVIFGRFVRPIVPNKYVEFSDPCLNRSGEIRPVAVGSSIVGRFVELQ